MNLYHLGSLDNLEHQLNHLIQRFLYHPVYLSHLSDLETPYHHALRLIQLPRFYLPFHLTQLNPLFQLNPVLLEAHLVQVVQLLHPNRHHLLNQVDLLIPEYHQYLENLFLQYYLVILLDLSRPLNQLLHLDRLFLIFHLYHLDQGYPLVQLVPVSHLNLCDLVHL